MSVDPEAAITQSWTTNASAWTEAVRSGSIESRERVTNQAIVDSVLRHNPATVLDLGCGEGWLARALAGQGVRATGVDGSPGLINAALAAGGGHFLHCSYQELMDNPGLVDGPFDAIVANFALLQETLAPLLSALHVLIAPQGRLIIQTVNPANVEQPDHEGWREESFHNFPGNWQAMPWFYRSLDGWRRLLNHCEYRLDNIHAPVDPDSQRPFSLILTARTSRQDHGL